MVVAEGIVEWLIQTGSTELKQDDTCELVDGFNKILAGRVDHIKILSTLDL